MIMSKGWINGTNSSRSSLPSRLASTAMNLTYVVLVSSSLSSLGIGASVEGKKVTMETTILANRHSPRSEIV